MESGPCESRSCEYDRALERLHAHGPNLTNWLFNHAPMVAEAMCRMGVEERIPDWLEREAARFEPRPEPGAPIDADAWRGLLGRGERFTDWSDFFRAEFERRGWRETLDTWAARLAPGLITAACHGWLRTAHATRALSHRENDVRLRELADGLASWASMYAEPPQQSARPTGSLAARVALARLRLVPPAQRPTQGMISAGVAALAFAEDFPADVARIDLSGPLAERCDEIVIAFAEQFVSCARTPFLAIVFAHAVTSAAAVRHLHGSVSPRTSAELLFRAWEAGCALRAAFHPGDEALAARAPVDPGTDPSAWPDAAVDHGDDHVIKLTEACLATWERRPDPALIRAVELVQRRLEPKPRPNSESLRAG